MRRGHALVSMLAIVLLSLLSAGGLALNAGAQDATPPTGGFEIAPGVTAEAVPAPVDPPALYRLHVAPGVTYQFEAAPSLDVGYVQAGTLTLRIDVPVTVASVGSTGSPGEAIPAGTEFTMTAGDYVTLPPFAAGEVRNTGGETATLAVAGLVPEARATPAA